MIAVKFSVSSSMKFMIHLFTFQELSSNLGICIEKATNHLKLGVQGLQGDVPRCVCGCQSILCTNTTKMALTCVPRAAAPALFTVLLCMAAVPASAFVAVPAKFSTTHGDTDTESLTMAISQTLAQTLVLTRGRSMAPQA